MTNKDDRTMEHLKFIDSQGREFENYDCESMHLLNKEALTICALPPSLEKIFWANYEPPADAWY